MPNEYGGIVDDLLVYRLDEDQCTDGEQAYMLVVNAGNIDKDWNADVHFPKEVPLKFQYELLIDILDEDFMYMEYGMVGFDFCSGNPEGCRWGEYCGCLQYK